MKKRPLGTDMNEHIRKLLSEIDRLGEELAIGITSAI